MLYDIHIVRTYMIGIKMKKSFSFMTRNSKSLNKAEERENEQIPIQQNITSASYSYSSLASLSSE